MSIDDNDPLWFDDSSSAEDHELDEESLEYPEEENCNE